MNTLHERVAALESGRLAGIRRGIEKEGLRHRAGGGQSGRFDHHALENEFSRGAARGQIAEGAH